MPCKSPEILQNFLPYAGLLDERSMDDIDLVVVHCTELPDLETARKYGERILYQPSGTGNSGHFYIDRDGQTQLWADTQRIAHHAGRYNHRSIGIELVNAGRWPDWLHSQRQHMTEAYPSRQLDALLDLLRHLESTHGRLRWITGHEQLDKSMVPASDDPDARVFRKVDPGPLFPWKQVLSSGRLTRFPVQQVS